MQQLIRETRTMALEIELKLLLASDDVVAVTEQLQQYLAQQHARLSDPVSLLNAYFETADLWFRRHDAGLRTRCKQGKFEQTIKLAGQQQGAAHVRPEYNLPCEGVYPELTAFPAQIWPQGTDVAQLQQALQEVFRTDFSRRKAVVGRGDTQIELVLDQGWVQAQGRQEAIAEIELELLSGDPQQLFVLAAELVEQLPLLAGFQSKAERGYRLAQQQPLQRLEVAQDLPLADLVKALLTNQLLAYQQQCPQADDWAVLQQRLATDPALACTLKTPADLVANPIARQLWLLEYTRSQLSL